MRASATDTHLFTELYPDAESPRLPVSEGLAITCRQNGHGAAGSQQVPLQGLQQHGPARPCRGARGRGSVKPPACRMWNVLGKGPSGRSQVSSEVAAACKEQSWRGWAVLQLLSYRDDLRRAVPGVPLEIFLIQLLVQIQGGKTPCSN